jgi:uncharacterized protein YaaW (UPF0174 family)
VAYEIYSLLTKCNSADFALLINQIESHLNLSADRELRTLLENFEKQQSNEVKSILVKVIEREIRYVGSSDIAYAYRKLTSKEEPHGVSFHEIISDVSNKLKIKQKLVGNIESKVERIVKFTVENVFFSMTQEEQRELFNKAGVGKGQQDEFFNKIKDNKAHFLPLLLSILGPEITMVIVQGLAISALAAFIGKKAAQELFKNLMARFPWWAEWLGPIVWGLSLSWLVFDLQGAANRKTIPIVIYLGIVGLRDGPEDEVAFWNQPLE